MNIKERVCRDYGKPWTTCDFLKGDFFFCLNSRGIFELSQKYLKWVS
jgi:hypothetical protein